MSKFKKTCFECGNKVDSLIEGRCENCFNLEFPPIEELKPIKAKVCNMCNKVHFSNTTITIEEFEKRMPIIVRKNLIVNENYKFNSLEIKDFSVKGNNISFKVAVDCSLK